MEERTVFTASVLMARKEHKLKFSAKSSEHGIYIEGLCPCGYSTAIPQDVDYSTFMNVEIEHINLASYEIRKQAGL